LDDLEGNKIKSFGPKKGLTQEEKDEWVAKVSVGRYDMPKLNVKESKR